MDGYVSRVKVTPGGYGKALYLTLSDGRTAVYAHLQGIAKPVQELVRKTQHETRNASVELYFSKDEAIHFQLGDTVAYSGRSGVKHPHVHFELRDSKERPINPLLSGYNVVDRFSPTPVSFALTPLDGYSTVEGDCQPRIYRPLIKQHDGIYRSRDPIGVSGRIGVSIKAFDRTDGSENLLAAYSFKLIVDDSVCLTTTFDKFDFTENKYFKLERDFRLKHYGKGIYHRLHRIVGNDLDFIEGDGIIPAGGARKEPVNVQIILEDAAGNISKVEIVLVTDQVKDDSRLICGEPLLRYKNGYKKTDPPFKINIMDNHIRLAGLPGIGEFKINGQSGNLCKIHQVEGGISTAWIPPSDFDGQLKIEAIDHSGQVTSYKDIKLYPVYPGQSEQITTYNRNVMINIPMGALYDTTWIRIVPEPQYQISGEIESVYCIEPRDQPLAGKVEIMIKKNENQSGFGWGLYYFDDKCGWTFLDDELQDGYLSASALSWERFGLVRDIDNPVVKILRLKDGNVLNTAKPKFVVMVMDSTSGLAADGLEMKIDGEIVPAEYDPPVDRLIYHTWKNLKGGSHVLEISVTDRVGNQTKKSLDFSVKP